MKNSLNVEAEGGELIIRNKNNDYAIIPKDMRREVINLMKKGCYDCIDKIVSTLPTANNYAEDGTIISDVSQKQLSREERRAARKARKSREAESIPTEPEIEETYMGGNLPQVTVTDKLPQWIGDKRTKTPKKVSNFETLDFRKWGLNDYSEYSSWNSAFRNAKERGEKEILWQGKRMKIENIDKKESDLYHESKEFLRNYYTNQDFTPYNDELDPKEASWEDFTRQSYGESYKEYSDKISNLSDKEYVKKKKEIKERLDLLSDTYIDENTGKPISKTQSSPEYKEYLKKKIKQSHIDALDDKGYYFTITSQPDKSLKYAGKVTSGANKKFYVTSDQEGEIGDLNTTYIHELAHKAQRFGQTKYDKDSEGFAYVNNTAKRIPYVDKTTISSDLRDYDRKAKSLKLASSNLREYLTDPDEIEARKMSTLFYMHKNKVNLDDIKSESDLTKFYTDYKDKMPSDVYQLFGVYKYKKSDLLKYLKNDFSYLNK